MKKPNGNTSYHISSFLNELLFLFIISFLSFPLHVKRIILFFVYFDDHKPSVTNPSLEEESLCSSCIVDVDPIPSFEIHVQHDVDIPISLEPDYSGHLVENKADSLLSIITGETCHQPIETHSQPTEFQCRIRERRFKPLRLSSTLHPYPPKFF